jgi:uncharacterized membrane protein YtjA (UPF0391 family)
MLHYAVVFIADLFGFTGLAASAAGIARILFGVFLVFAAVTLPTDVVRRGWSPIEPASSPCRDL